MNFRGMDVAIFTIFVDKDQFSSVLNQLIDNYSVADFRFFSFNPSRIPCCFKKTIARFTARKDPFS